MARYRQLPVGAVVFDEGQASCDFHLLLSGTVRLVRATAEGAQVTVLHVPAREVFGLGAPLGTLLRRETAIAAEACDILTWPSFLWQDFSDIYQGFAQQTLRSFGRRSDEMSNRIVELVTKQVEQRIACALLRLISQSGRKVAAGVEIGFPVTRQHIAEMSGTTLHTASRVLSGWEKHDLIKSSRCHVVVTDPHGLVLISMASGRAVGAALSKAGPI